VGTGSIYVPAPNNSTAAVQSFKILAADPNRYRVTFHPYVASGSLPQLWIGKYAGDVVQAASGVPASGFPLPTGNVSALHTIQLHWGDDCFVASDITNTVDAWLFWCIERYV
jgi:hypothetical protein